MVQTGATGRPFPGWEDVAEDIIPAVDDTYDLGAEDKRWAYIYAVIAVLTSLVIGGIYVGATTEGYFFINATTEVNGSLFINENITINGNLTMLGTIADFSNANVTGAYFFGDGSQLHGIQHGALALFLLNNASDIAGSKILFTDVGVATAVTLSKAITATGTEYQNWTTNDGVPNLHELLDGVNEMHVHARVTGPGTKDTTLLWKLWQNDTSGNMNLLFTSEESSILTTTLSAINIHMTVNEHALNLSDRLTIQLIANIAGAGGNPTVEVQIEGVTASRVELVVPGANVGTFVPYSGAIRNLDLGDWNFSTDAYFVGDGSFLTGITVTESDPLAYNGTLAYLSDILGWSYYNSSDFDINDYRLLTNFSFINATSYFSGKVGIGTSSPDSAFHIKAGVSGLFGQIIIQNPADDVTSNAAITAYESDGSGNPDQQLWYLGSSSSGNEDIIFWNRGDAKLTLGTNDTSRITILGNGNVGIGIIAPATTLEVTGNITLSDANNCVIFDSGGTICSGV